MPECPKCGKMLSNANCLMYHLAKKFPCDSYKCKSCQQIFATKFHLQVHEMKCEVAALQNKKKLSLNPFSKVAENGAGPSSQSNQTDQVLLQYIYDTCPDIIMQTDTAYNIQSISPSVEALLGYTQGELIGNSAHDLLHEEDKERIIELGMDEGRIRFDFSDGNCTSGVATEKTDDTDNTPTYTSLRKKHKNGSYVVMSSVFWKRLSKDGNKVDGLISIDRLATHN